MTVTKRVRAASHWSESPLARIIRPMNDFIQQEQSSGIILLAVTVLALSVANSPLHTAYNDVMHMQVGITIGPFALNETVVHWINDGLMAIFFFLVGLEIKREILVGELSTPRAAMLPIVAAAGGATVPALIYIALNGGRPGSAGWGIPMATDIAFALGCLALLGNRVPFGLKVFLTAVAIVDDLIAVLVIALFYSASIQADVLVIGLFVVLLLLGANSLGVRQPFVYAALGVVVWLAFLKSGIHATIAGVLVALTVPARYRIDGTTFLKRADSLLHTFDPPVTSKRGMLVDEEQQSAVIALEELCEQVQAPLQKIEHSLHGWVALLIMPVFAFANAGVALQATSLGGESLPLMAGIVLGLVLGKPIGLVLSAWAAVRLGIADLPHGATWPQLIGIGALAGIGFTMALFIASLAFKEAALLDSAKIGILIASVIAGVIGMLVLIRTSQPRPGQADEVEQPTT